MANENNAMENSKKEITSTEFSDINIKLKEDGKIFNIVTNDIHQKKKKGDEILNNSWSKCDKGCKNLNICNSKECLGEGYIYQQLLHNQQDMYQTDVLEKNHVVPMNDADRVLEKSYHPLAERWEPLGANYDDTLSGNGSDSFSPYLKSELIGLSGSPSKSDISDMKSQFRCIEEELLEQELLTSSLLALTSHFAHVQLRVRQIVEAHPDERDQLLKDLDEFAFQGIPEPMSSNVITSAPKRTSKEKIYIEDVDSREKQCELITHLKSQLCELEKLAYESGAPVLPQQVLLEKQKVIIDELKTKLNLRLEDHELPQLSCEELKCQVDNAIGEFVGPLKMKEQLVSQLKTQITDLERFIFFLQCDTVESKMKTLQNSNDKFTEAYNSYAVKKRRTTFENIVEQNTTSDDLSINSLNPSCSHTGFIEPEGVRECLNSKAYGLMDRASVLMQIFASTHFGSKVDSFQKNTLKKTSKGNHWGDLRAQLEVDIQEVASLAATLSCDREKLMNLNLSMKSAQSVKPNSSKMGPLSTIKQLSHQNLQDHPNAEKQFTVSSDSDEDVYDCFYWHHNIRKARQKGDSINALSRELTTAVRKKFAVTLQKLIQHGMRNECSSPKTSLIVPFLRCFNPSLYFTTEHESFHGRQYGDKHSFAMYDYCSPSQKREATDDNNTDLRLRESNDHGHAWELILEYYYLKNGDEYNNTPARKLSQSFNLEILDSKGITVKQNLLMTIANIMAMHSPYKRSLNAHFKAFVCAGLNSKQLVEWLKLILNCNNLIEHLYTPNSYIVRTGFHDSLRSIDVLMKYDFHLPVDLAIRHFKNI